jgi:TolB-like protein
LVNLPTWSSTALLGILIASFPAALYLAWNYERSPEGFVKTTSQQSWQNPYKAGQRKPFTGSFVIVGLVLMIVFMYFYPRFQHSDQVPQSSETILESSVIDKSIAVLPFKNQSAEEDNQYFADGVRDAILNKLSKVEELRVTSSTSVEKFRNTTKTIAEIATELNVAHILVGSAQKYGQEIKITTQLINTVSDAQVWSQDYTRTFEDVLYLESEIAEKVALELTAALSIEEMEDLRKLPTKNTEAYNYLLLADFQSNKYTKEGLTNAIPLYEKAIEIDPDFAEAYVKLSLVWIRRGGPLGTYDQKVAWSNAKKLFTKSLELDPNNSEVYNLLASGYFYHEWNFEKAHEYFNRIKEINPNETDWSPDFYIKIGEFEKALVTCEGFIELDPLDSWNYDKKATAQYFLGRKLEAIQTLDEAARLFDDFLFQIMSARLYYLFGEIGKSIDTFEKLKNHFPDRPPITYWLEAVHAQHEGRDVQVYIDQLEEMYNNTNSGSPAWYIALSYAAAKDEESVFEWLEKSYDRHEVEMTWLKVEPALEPLRSDPRWQEMLDKVGFPK